MTEQESDRGSSTLDQESAEKFKEAMSRFASGVTVVSCASEDGPLGITVSAFISVSLTPPLVLVSISKEATLSAQLASAGGYGVSILSAAQEDESNHFAGWGREGFTPRFAELAGRPVLEEALCTLSCRVAQRVNAGDHTLLIGEVEGVELGGAHTPLIYAQRRYQRLASDDEGRQ